MFHNCRAAAWLTALLVLLSASGLEAKPKKEKKVKAPKPTDGWIGDKDGDGNSYTWTNTYYVRTSGKDTNDGKSAKNAFRTLSKAAQVAGPADRVLVGAGVYQEADTIAFTKTNAWNKWPTDKKSRFVWRGPNLALTLYDPCLYVADQSGKYTGDAGDVIIRAPANKSVWALKLSQTNNYAFRGFTFVEDPATKIYSLDPKTNAGKHDTPAYGYRPQGVYADQGGLLVFDSCNFTGLEYGVHTSGSSSVLVNQCNFENPRYLGLYANLTTGFQVDSCQFDYPLFQPTWGNALAVYGWQSEVTLRSCTFDADLATSDDRLTHLVCSNGTSDGTTVATLDVQDCDFFSAPQYGVATSWAKSCVCQDSTFEDCRYAVYGHALAGTIDNCAVSADDDVRWWRDSNWGVFAGHDNSSTWTCQNTTIRGHHIAVYAGASDLTLKNNALEGTGADYYVNTGSAYLANPDFNDSYGVLAWGWEDTSGGKVWKGCQKLKLTSSSATFKNFHMAVHGAKSEITLDGLTLAGHCYGAYGEGSFTIKNCQFEDNVLHGLAVWLGKSVTVTGAKFVQNGLNKSPYDAAQGGVGWGLYYYGAKTYASDAEYWNGVPGDSQFTLKNCEFTRNGHGLFVAALKQANITLANNQIVGPLEKKNDTWIKAGWGAWLGGGDYQLTADSQLACTTNYYGLGAYRSKIKLQNLTIAGNVFGVHPHWNLSSELVNCTLKDNSAYGLYTYRDQSTTARNCRFEKNGHGQYDAWSRSVLLEDCTAVSNTGNGIGGENGGQFVARNVKSQSNGAHGAAFNCVEDLQLDGVTCEKNKNWNAYAYVDYYREHWKPEYASAAASPWYDRQSTGFELQKLTARPAQRDRVQVVNSTFADSQETGGLYLYAYEKDALFQLRKLSVKNNLWYGVYCDRGTCLDPAVTSLDLKFSDNWHALVLSNQSVALNGMKGMEFTNNNAGLCVWDGNASLKNCTLGANAWGLYLSRGALELDNCAFNGSGVLAYYPTAGKVTGTTIRDSRVDRKYRDNPDWRWVGQGFYAWSDKALPGFEFRNCTFSNNYYGLYVSTYAGGDVTLDNVACDKNGAHGAVVEHVRVTATNCKFTGSEYSGLYTDSRIYNAAAGQWEPVEQPVSATQCQFSGNGHHGLLVHYSPATVTNCQAQGNGQYGLYVYDKGPQGALSDIRDTQLTGNGYGLVSHYAGLKLTNVTASDNAQTGVYVTLHDELTLTNCTASNNQAGAGLYLHGRYELAQQITNGQGNVTSVYQPTGASRATLVNCTTSGNGGYGAISLYNAATLEHCVADQNQGTGLHAGYSAVALAQCSANSNGEHGIYTYGQYQTPQAAKLTQCRAENNRQHGLLAYYGHVSAENCTFSGNGGCGSITVDDGEDTFVAVACAGNQDYGLISQRSQKFLAERCLLQGNAGYGLSAYDTNSALAKNCLITGNNYGVLLADAGSGIELWNCTIADSKLGFGVRAYAGLVSVRNCIIANNNQWGLYIDGGTVNHSHNLISGQFPGTDFFQAGLAATAWAGLRDKSEPDKPPRFAAPEAGNYQLAKGSPAINSGVDAQGIVNNDLAGNARPLFKSYEMGAYEFTEPSGSLRVLEWVEERGERGKLVPRVVKRVDDLLDDVTDTVGGVVGTVGDTVGNVGDKLGGKAGDVVGDVGGAVGGVGNAVKGASKLLGK